MTCNGTRIFCKNDSLRLHYNHSLGCVYLAVFHTQPAARCYYVWHDGYNFRYGCVRWQIHLSTAYCYIVVVVQCLQLASCKH